MQFKTLGRTGLSVSVAGLGGGGNSRLGLGRGASRSECADLVRDALDLGVNFVDTAEAYGTENIVGSAIAGRDRSSGVISTKSRIRMGGALAAADQVINNLDASLGRLGTDYVDVSHLHAVAPRDYEYARETIAHALMKARDSGKLRHIGITETGPNDPHQVILFGTGDRAHLRANIAAINAPPLERPAVELLHSHFADLVGVGLDLPDHVRAPEFPDDGGGAISCAQVAVRPTARCAQR